MRFLVNSINFSKNIYRKIAHRPPKWFRQELKIFLLQNKENVDFKNVIIRPILDDKFDDAGVIGGHYFHQDLFVAKKILESNPVRHVDIGSRIDGFIAHVAVFRKIEVLDIRKLESKVANIIFTQIDLMNEMLEDDFCDSISSLHAIEHFGLGRYGDPIDANGHLKAIKNIARLLKSKGIFYFSVPIGNQRVEFNAHRVFALSYLIPILKEYFEVISLSIVDDKGDFHENLEINELLMHSSFGCQYGCGIFILERKEKNCN